SITTHTCRAFHTEQRSACFRFSTLAELLSDYRTSRPWCACNSSNEFADGSATHIGCAQWFANWCSSSLGSRVGKRHTFVAKCLDEHVLADLSRRAAIASDRVRDGTSSAPEASPEDEAGPSTGQRALWNLPWRRFARPTERTSFGPHKAGLKG